MFVVVCFFLWLFTQSCVFRIWTGVNINKKCDAPKNYLQKLNKIKCMHKNVDLLSLHKYALHIMCEMIRYHFLLTHWTRVSFSFRFDDMLYSVQKVQKVFPLIKCIFYGISLDVRILFCFFCVSNAPFG